MITEIGTVTITENEIKIERFTFKSEMDSNLFIEDNDSILEVLDYLEKRIQSERNKVKKHKYESCDVFSCSYVTP